jgi:hypothetical protein
MDVRDKMELTLRLVAQDRGSEVPEEVAVEVVETV